MERGKFRGRMGAPRYFEGDARARAIPVHTRYMYY